MVEERRKSRNVYGVMCLFLGIVLLLIINSFLGTTMVFNKVDYEALQVRSLFCTFERVEFEVEDVISNATGEKVTRVNVIVGTESFLFYTYNISKEEFVDVGLLHWNDEQLLAFSSEEFEDGMNYVVDNGRIIYLVLYGVSHSRRPIVRIDESHQKNWFDDFVSKSSIEISLLMGFALVLTCSLFSLPIIEYYINHKIEKKATAKKKKSTPKKATNK